MNSIVTTQVTVIVKSIMQKQKLVPLEVKDPEEYMQFLYWLIKQCEYELTHFPLPVPAEQVAKTMTNAGYKVYLVGGAVRDTMKNNTKLDETITWAKAELSQWQEKYPKWKAIEIQMP